MCGSMGYFYCADVFVGVFAGSPACVVFSAGQILLGGVHVGMCWKRLCACFLDGALFWAGLRRAQVSSCCVLRVGDGAFTVSFVVSGCRAVAYGVFTDWVRLAPRGWCTSVLRVGYFLMSLQRGCGSGVGRGREDLCRDSYEVGRLVGERRSADVYWERILTYLSLSEARSYEVFKVWSVQEIPFA